MAKKKTSKGLDKWAYELDDVIQQYSGPKHQWLYEHQDIFDVVSAWSIPLIISMVKHFGIQCQRGGYMPWLKTFFERQQIVIGNMYGNLSSFKDEALKDKFYLIRDMLLVEEEAILVQKTLQRSFSDRFANMVLCNRHGWSWGAVEGDTQKQIEVVVQKYLEGKGVEQPVVVEAKLIPTAGEVIVEVVEEVEEVVEPTVAVKNNIKELLGGE